MKKLFFSVFILFVGLQSPLSAKEIGFQVSGMIRTFDDRYIVVVDGPFLGTADRLIIATTGFQLTDNDKLKRVPFDPDRNFYPYDYPPKILLNGKDAWVVTNDIDTEQVFPKTVTKAPLYYDGYHLMKVCQRSKNKKIALVFLAIRGGTASSGQGDALFVFFNEKTQRIDFETINLDDWDWSGCLDKARESEKIGKKIRKQEQHILDTLAPRLWDSKSFVNLEKDRASDWQPLPLKPLQEDPRPLIKSHFEKNAAYYTPPKELNDILITSEEDLGRSFYLARYGSGFEKMLSTDWYDYYVLTFRDDCRGNGVIFLYEKNTGKWLGLYRLPGGCSKVDYYWPNIQKTTQTMIEGEFCTDCSWWGEYAPFQLDIKRKRYRRMKTN